MTGPHEIEIDWKIRTAAFDRIRDLTESGDTLEWSEIAKGFEFEGERHFLATKARGIFRPRKMPYVLSIRTSVPRAGRKVWYGDQQAAHDQIYSGQDGIDYAFMGDNPDCAENRWLREAMDLQLPLIYFLGISPSVYQAIYPVYVGGWDRNLLRARIAFASIERPIHYGLPDDDERKYAFKAAKRRLHQASFRQAVMAAYGNRCALSRLKVPRLLDAAHIIPDKDEILGQPIVRNGLPLSKTHHAAFDSNLIGIDADFMVHVSGKLLDARDGPMLEAIKQLNGRKLLLPRRPDDHPDRQRLESRFAEFRQAN